MKKSIIVLWIATIISIIFLGLTQRYTIAGGGERFYAYKLDKLTGRVWIVKGTLEQVLVPIKKPQSPDEKGIVWEEKK